MANLKRRNRTHKSIVYPGLTAIKYQITCNLELHLQTISKSVTINFFRTQTLKECCSENCLVLEFSLVVWFVQTPNESQMNFRKKMLRTRIKTHFGTKRNLTKIKIIIEEPMSQIFHSFTFITCVLFLADINVRDLHLRSFYF